MSSIYPLKRCLSGNFVGFLRKPFKKSELFDLKRWDSREAEVKSSGIRHGFRMWLFSLPVFTLIHTSERQQWVSQASLIISRFSCTCYYLSHKPLWTTISPLSPNPHHLLTISQIEYFQLINWLFFSFYSFLLSLL